VECDYAEAPWNAPSTAAPSDSSLERRSVPSTDERADLSAVQDMPGCAPTLSRARIRNACSSYAALTSMCLTFFLACSVFGRSMVSKPFLKEAAILDSSISPGIGRTLRKDPYVRSFR